MAQSFGPLVRLWGVGDAQLPEPSAAGDELAPLLTSILLEALHFIADVPSAQQLSPGKSSWTMRGTRRFLHSNSPVYLYERIVQAEALDGAARDSGHSPARPETWFLRRSLHEDAAAEGTASWDEWVRSFKQAHAQTELEFTPTVLSTRREREWDCSGIEVEADGERWGDLTLRLEESVHKMPAPLHDRVFPVLQTTASVVGDRREFLVVQIAAGGVTSMRQGSNVVGAYTSIERFRDTDEGVEWTMGTVSDAKGVLPAWVQKMAVPGAVAKDVDMFLDWIRTQRPNQTG